VGIKTAVGIEATVGIEPPAPSLANIPVVILPTVGFVPSVDAPTAVPSPTVGLNVKRRIKPIRTPEDALTLAGQVLYHAMYGLAGAPGESRACNKGYRQLAAETRLDKDTVRDLIAEFKEKAMLRETGRYDPDTRMAKTYQVFAPDAIVAAWRQAGIHFVASGRQRPTFCSALGEPLTLKPTVG